MPNYKFGTPFQDYLYSRVLTGVDPKVEEAVGTSGYWGKPVTGLDPRLIDEATGNVRGDIRLSILEALYTFWEGAGYVDAESWSTVWIAGSALSHQFAEHSQPDLDTLIGVDYPEFYAANPAFRGLSQAALSERFNAEFRTYLDPETANFLGQFELTFYVNPGASDIRSINPYAAYNLSADEWTVQPIDVPEDWDPKSYFPAEWWKSLDTEVEQGKALVLQYGRIADMVRRLPTGDPVQLSYLAQLRTIAQRATTMFKDIHDSRRRAFNSMGQGYFDYTNLRWQVHKRAGVVSALNEIAKINQGAREYQQGALYGEPLDDEGTALAKAQLVHSALGSTQWYRRHLGGTHR